MFKFCAVFSISLNVSFVNDYSFGVGGSCWFPFLVQFVYLRSASTLMNIFFYTFVALKSCSNLYDGEYKLPVQVKEWREDLKYSPTAYL